MWMHATRGVLWFQFSQKACYGVSIQSHGPGMGGSRALEVTSEAFVAPVCALCVVPRGG